MGALRYKDWVLAVSAYLRDGREELATDLANAYLDDLVCLLAILRLLFDLDLGVARSQRDEMARRLAEDTGGVLGRVA